MCLLAVLFRVTDDAPLVVAANREEYYARGGLPPRRLDGLAAVAGVDPTHGGTWLGVNTHGVLIAVTNRRKSTLPAQPRSRGLLARDLLACPTAAEAARLAATELQTGRYAGCNYLCADSHDAIVLHAGDWLRVRPLPAGVHVLANADVNDPTDPRVCYTARWLEQHDLRHSPDTLAFLRQLCASPEPAGAPLCFRLHDRGTVSSSLLALPQSLHRATYLHAQGPPDKTSYIDLSPLLWELTPTTKG